MSNANLAAKLKQREEEDQMVLEAASELIKAKIQRGGNTAVVQCEMGKIQSDGQTRDIISYIGTRTIRDLSNDALFKLGIEMEFMKDSFDSKGQLIVDQNNSEELAQRNPDWSRQISMTSYLLRNKYRKFGTILVVVSPKWVNDPSHENWDPETGRAKVTSIQFEKLIPSIDEIGVIEVGSVDVFALDGQHRLIGMRGLKELAAGRIFPKLRSGEAKKESIEKEEFLELNGSTPAELDDIFDEKITVEYLPAVIAGETMREAKQRIRSVFVAINKNAKKPLAGETILLDEDDGYAIVARAIGKSHRLLQASGTEGRVNWRNTSIPKRSHWIVTLQHLRTMSQTYLEHAEPNLVMAWENKKLGTQRPSDEQLAEARTSMSELFDYLAKLPTYQKVMACHRGEDLDKIRIAETNILTRPIGFTILADAIGQLIHGGESLEKIFEKLEKFDRAGGFEQGPKTSIWWGVTLDSKDRMITANTSTAADLLKWTLFGQTHTDGPTLSDKCKALRLTTSGDTYVSFDGTEKPYSEMSGSIDLPETII